MFFYKFITDCSKSTISFNAPWKRIMKGILNENAQKPIVANKGSFSRASIIKKQKVYAMLQFVGSQHMETSLGLGA